jgi:hypothetical protein
MAEEINGDMDSFALANRAFDLFRPSERLRALHVFAGLQYPSIADRFTEAVYRVCVLLQNEPVGEAGEKL